MAKKIFYTERDIENLATRGKTTLAVNDNVVLTDLAREKAAKLGITLNYGAPTPDSPPMPAPLSVSNDVMAAKIKAAVLAKVGPGVSEELLDIIIPQVLAKLANKNGDH